ncbi:YncE family protein [Sinirhodobacter populi]|uniref:YncE family protein n=1 Tax=Paenirhodobacter populi TaxID=2306993 RepID=A0A443KHL7_9RHOB|nr:YncE family protein [Sinirhodobacter populi]RWR32244.1 YncE family protein [Sinirhodobacter populi]
MAFTLTTRLRVPVALSLGVLLGSASMVLAQSAFDTPAPFTGTVRFSGEQGAPIYGGAEVSAAGTGFAPNQPVTVLRGDERLSPEGLKADGEGKFSFDFALPADAVVGIHPVVVQTDAPDSADVIDFKVSPKIPVSGAEKFDITSKKVGRGLYQVAYSEKNKALFVASAVGRPPVKESALYKLDPETLDVVAQVAPEAAPQTGDRDPGVFAVYGIGLDDEKDTVWVTNTRQNTVAVYAQGDLSLIKQFDLNTVPHPRDVVVDAANDKAYVSSAMNNLIAVFDTNTLEPLAPIELSSAQRGGRFSTMSLTLDPKGGKLYTVSMTSPEAAKIDLATGEVQILKVPGSVSGAGVAVDPATGRLFVASQGSDDLIAIDTASEEVLFDTAVGAGALNVAFDAKDGTAYVANRGADTITVVDATSGEIIANLDAGSYPNQLIATADGTVYAVNKARGQDDTEGDMIWRIVPKK